ncbi:MAG: Ig-like domain-containing protein, partial [Candidatus Thorarchaeota archaeon]
MLMQRKMGLAVASVTVILTIMTFAPYLVPVAVTSDGTESNGTTPDNTLPEAPPPGTLAYWKLNENSGSYASDSVDPPVDGYIQGGSMWIPGVSGSGLNLSTNQYIDFGTNTGLYALNYLTIEAWVNLEDTSGLHTIIMNAYSSIYIMYHFGIEDGHIYFHRQSAQPSSSYTSPGTISAGEWHHVAIVMNGGGRYLSFYIDGLEEQMITNYDGYHGPAGFATIGADRVTGTPSFLDGMVDEVIVFDTILTHTMIWDHYQKGLRGLGYFDDIPPNEAPVANDDSYTMDQDAVLSEGAPGILANDIDNDGDSLETDLISGPTNGALTLNPDGSFVYTPAGGFVGVDSFEYRAFDGTDYSSSATVTITVQAVDHPPVAVDDEYATNEDLLLSIASPGVLVNDYDPDSGDIITSELVTGPEHGSLTFFSEGGFEYVPNPDWFGTDSFIYRAFDGQVYGNEATVTITVTGVNDVPIAGDDSYSGTEDAVLVGSSVLDNDIDPDGDYLEINLISLPSYGVLTLNPDGSFTFVPDADWYGTDSFTYELYDGQLFSNTATVTITISSVNDVPVSYDDTFSVDEDVDLTEFLSATDVDEDSLTYELVSGTSNGILIFRSTGTFTYSPNANWFGTDTFTFWVYDGQEYSNIATITILVTSINDIPIAGDDEFTTDEDTTLIGSVLDNDYDVEWDLQEVYLESGPSYGGLDLNTDTGVFTYYPEANWFGIDYFTYYVFDGYAYSNIATVTITVNGVNDAPFVFDVYYIGYEGV